MLGDLTINDAAPAAKTFKKIRSGTDFAAWTESTATGTDFREIIVRTQSAGKAAQPGAEKYRYLFQVRHTKWNATLGKMEEAVASFTFTWSTVAGLVRADYDHLIAFIKNYIGTSANVDALFRREV